MGRLKKLKKIRIHREGTHTLAGSLLLILAVNAGLYFGIGVQDSFLRSGSYQPCSLWHLSELLPLPYTFVRPGRHRENCSCSR